MLSHRHLRLLLLLTLGVIFLAPDSAYAQRPRRGGKARHAGRNTEGDRSPRSQGPAPGSAESTFKEFEPVTDQEDDTLLGVLSVKPLKGGGTLKLNVRRHEELKLYVGDRIFDMDPIPEFLTKGVFCTASWEWDAKPGGDVEKRVAEGKPRRNDPKRLQSLRLDTLQVEGEIVEIGGDIITLKVKPVNDQMWPDVAARLARKPENQRSKPKRVPAKTLRLRIVDGISGFKDAALQELSLGDFEVEQKIQASIVYAGSSKKNTGILVDLNSLTAEEREGESEAGPRNGPRRGGEGPGGPRPRRGRPRRG